MHSGEVVFFCNPRSVLCCFCKRPMSEGEPYVQAIFKDKEAIAHTHCAEEKCTMADREW